MENVDITCQFDLPLKRDDRNPNLVMSIHAESFADCARGASYINEYRNPNAKYFFWSPKNNPVGKLKSLNCLVFKSCDVDQFIDLKSPGYTYMRCPVKGKI